MSIHWRYPAAVAVGLILTTSLSAQPPPRPPAPPAVTSSENVQELTRGPLHEAFGQPTVFNPQPGPLVAKRPPELVNEVPPELKPEGDNVGWVPGYWAWEDEAKSHIWVSGFWRVVPPGRVWIPGYWHTVKDGYRWVSGFWGANESDQVTYLPPPPESLEAGPPNVQRDDNQIWIPGVWMWRESRYWWRPGFWTAANADWVWVPAHYEWTPNGYVFIDGYWDYPLFDRGLLFAPVMFTSLPAEFTYIPGVTIDVRYLAGALFDRPATVHYYFGDYYDESYIRAGVYPWFAFHGSRYGYDPLFAQTSYVYARRDPQWAPRVRETYVTRRENREARPPHTLREFNDWARRADPDGRQSVAFVRPFADAQRDRDFPMRLERLDERRIATIRNQADQVRKFRAERIQLEEQAARDIPRVGSGTDPRAGRTAPARVRIPDPPRLTQTPIGVGGKVPPTKGVAAGTTGRSANPPDPPRVPELTPPGAGTETAPRPARPLPLPEEVLRIRPGTESTLPKGRLSDPVPTPKSQGDPPGTLPKEKDPPKQPVRTPPGTDPPERVPPGTIPPSNGPGKDPPQKVEPRAPSITPRTPPPKVDPPATPPKKDG